MNEAAGGRNRWNEWEKDEDCFRKGHKAPTVDAAGFWRQGLPWGTASGYHPMGGPATKNYFKPRCWYLGNTGAPAGFEVRAGVLPVTAGAQFLLS